MKRVIFIFFVVVAGSGIPGASYSQGYDNTEEFGMGNEDLEGFKWGEEVEFESDVVAPSLLQTAGEQQISPSQIQQNSPKNTAELLTLSPGISIVQHGAEGKAHQLFLRGFDAAHGADVEVRLDGVVLNEPSNIHGNGYLDLYGIIPEVVQRITVQKGPFDSSQGSFATGGSILFKLGVPPAYRDGMMRSEVDSRGRVRAVQVVASPTDNQRFVAFDGVFDPGFAENREAARVTGIAKYRRSLGASLDGEILVNTQMASFESPGVMALNDVQSGDRDFYDTYGSAGEGASKRILLLANIHKKQEGTEFHWQAFGIRRAFSLEENFTGFLVFTPQGDKKHQSHDSVTFGSDVTFKYGFKLFPSITMLSGAGWRVDRIWQSEHQVDTTGRVWQTNILNTGDIHQLYAFGGVAWKPLPWIQLKPSVRLNGGVYNGNDALRSVGRQDVLGGVFPRVAAQFPLNRTVSLFASYGRGFRMPEARAFLVTPNGENTDVSKYRGGNAEISMGEFWEWGVSMALPQNWNLKAIGYGTYMANEMVFDHVSNTNLEKNSTRRLGGEFVVAGEPLSWLSILGDIALVSARFIETQNYVPGIPVVLSNGRVFFGKSLGPHGGMSVSIMGTRHLAHAASVGSSVDATLNGGWRFKNLDVGVVVDNLFAQKTMAGAYHFSSRFEENESSRVLPKIHYAPGNPFTVRLLLTVYL